MINQRIPSIVSVFLTILSFSAFAQVNFDATQYYFNHADYNSFIPKVITDINGDNRDDVLLVHGDNVRVYHNSQSTDSLYLAAKFKTASIEPWAQGVLDLENDGINEMFFAGLYDGLFVYKNLGDNQYSLDQQVSAGDFFAQAFSIADIDNDGFIDLFVCHDDGHSKVFLNDGEGVLVDRSDYIDMATTPVSDNSGNYSSVWTDIDNDNDNDLYIGKCRLGVTEDTDPRRINALFLNNGDGTFTEVANERGVASGAQSWAADYGDFNGDGYQDLVVINHDFPNQLFINDGNGSFLEDMSFRDLVPNNGTAYQSIIADFDNNGWEDIIVAGSISIIYWNEGGTFTSEVNGSGISQFLSGAFGDINHDGFLDLYAGSSGLGGPSGRPDLIYVNEANDNNFVSATLKGTVSNSMGIGAHVIVHTPSGRKCRFSKSGVSYSIQNTLNQHFGLGQEGVIDSITVDWPSGIHNVYTDISVNEHVVLVEDDCQAELPEIFTTDEPFICENSGESITIFSNDGVLNWSTGEVAEQITVDVAGVYQGFKENCEAASNALIIHNTPTINPPILNVSENITLCEGASVEITVLNYEEIEWQDGTVSNSYIIDQSGSVQAQILSSCANVYSEEIMVTFVTVPTDSDRQEIVSPGPTTITTDVDGTKWYSDEEATNLIGEGPEYSFDAVSDVSYYFTVSPDITPIATSAGLMMEDETLNDNFFNENGLMYFSPQRNLTIKSVNVETTASGIRDILLVRSDGEELGRKTVDLEAGSVYTVELDWEVTAGENYRMTTDTEINQSSFGENHPHFKVSFNPSFPLEFDTWLTLTNSSFPSIYFFFFDWELEEAFDPCTSEVYEYALSVVSSTEEVYGSNSLLNAFPNPASTEVVVSSDIENETMILQAFNMLGQLQYESEFSGQLNLDVQEWNEGQYLFKLSTENRQISRRFTIAR